LGLFYSLGENRSKNDAYAKIRDYKKNISDKKKEQLTEM
jgi:hypothetical protein